MIHLQFIHLVKSVSDLINVICGKNFLSRTLTEMFQLLHKVYQRMSGKY